MVSTKSHLAWTAAQLAGKMAAERPGMPNPDRGWQFCMHLRTADMPLVYCMPGGWRILPSRRGMSKLVTHFRETLGLPPDPDPEPYMDLPFMPYLHGGEKWHELGLSGDPIGGQSPPQPVVFQPDDNPFYLVSPVTGQLAEIALRVRGPEGQISPEPPPDWELPIMDAWGEATVYSYSPLLG